ncbi:MAG: cyclodeaminase/cyclohydrolase family protein [Clostridiaceae bacterium]|nr:cyclodeaminase/cyclohydrolase family protein [Clostridiaceae bacterium]
MKLTEMTVKDYLDLLASDAPAPGGGSASAFCGAQGAGLCAMVAALTLGKKKYADDQALCERVQGEALELQHALTAQIDADTDAFGLISAAIALPKDTEEQKTARRAALRSATLEATHAPLQTLKLSRRALELTGELVGHSNTNCASDLGVAGHNLLACAEGAFLNVEINLPGIGDEEKAAQLGGAAKEELSLCRGLAAKLCQ